MGELRTIKKAIIRFKNMRIQVLVSILAISLSMSCKKAPNYLNESVKIDYEKSEFISLANEDIEIEFASIKEDSRCPPNANCFWAGQVAVEISINNETKFTLGFHEDYEPKAQYDDYIISLLSVKYGSDKSWGRKKCSSIELIVEK